MGSRDKVVVTDQPSAVVSVVRANAIDRVLLLCVVAAEIINGFVAATKSRSICVLIERLDADLA